MQIVGQPAQIAVANERILGQMSAYIQTHKYIYMYMYVHNREERKKVALNEERSEGRARAGGWGLGRVLRKAKLLALGRRLETS